MHWWRGRVDWQKDKNTKTRNGQILSKNNHKHKHSGLGLGPALALGLGVAGRCKDFLHVFSSLFATLSS